MIGTCSVLPGVSDREAVFQVLDQALNTTIEGPNGIGRLALYNPFTSQIAYNSVPNTITFTDREPIDLDSEGTAAVLTGEKMKIAGREFYVVDPSLDEVEFAFAAHRN
jgi:hypothetical protein